MMWEIFRGLVWAYLIYYISWHVPGKVAKAAAAAEEAERERIKRAGRCLRGSPTAVLAIDLAVDPETNHSVDHVDWWSHLDNDIAIPDEEEYRALVALLVRLERRTEQMSEIWSEAKGKEEELAAGEKLFNLSTHQVVQLREALNFCNKVGKSDDKED